MTQQSHGLSNRWRHKIRRRILAWLVVGMVFFLSWVVLIMWLENSFIFFPSPYPEGDWSPWGLAIEEALFEAADGTKLHGWYLEHPAPRAVVLFCHGNAGNITHRADILEKLHAITGVSVLVFDYRGYGRSEGAPDEAGVLADARAARRWLAQRTGVQQQDVILLGRSLGGAIAVILGAEDGARAVILDSTFTSVPDMASIAFPLFPVKPFIRTQLSALERIRDYHGPVLISHGDTDRIVPIEMGRRLFEAANPPKEFLLLDRCDHNDSRPDSYYERLVRFLESLP